MSKINPGLYWWVRDIDETGMSGTGPVAQVAVFEDGSAVLRWIKDRNSAGVASTCFYETAEQLIHVHGHGDKKTGYLEPAYCIGDVVVWHCMEGFGGVAEVLAVRKGEPSIQVKILEPRWTEHSYQPVTWAYAGEITRKVK